MTDIAIECIGLSKKFTKGELHDSLRDLIPAITGKFFRTEKSIALSKKQFWALDDVSFQLPRGGALGIIGHNGAGKSTLLKILSGIMKPTKGGFNINGKLSALIEVGAGFHPDLTGRENIYLNGLILGMSRKEVNKKFDEIVNFSGLSEFIDTPVKRYSSGMYARLGFSVSAHVNPDVLLVDEVLSVGDYAFQQKCAQKMQTLVEDGTSIIFISHNLAAVMKLCDTCILLERGKIVSTGNPEDVVKDYLDGPAQNTGQNQNNKIIISKVAVLKNGAEDSRFNAGEEALIDVVVESKIDLKDVALHIELRSDNDYQVFEVYTELLNEGGFSIKKGEAKKFRIGLSLHLAAGVYHLGAFIVDRLDVSKRYHRIFPAATLHITAQEAVRCVVNLYPQLLKDN